ncbi:hypothetical protein FRC02_012027 [Tulasnella sp. 418]|nr:hypothetical protein FRC02_012027 [Tulasnella sp. 418]
MSTTDQLDDNPVLEAPPKTADPPVAVVKDEPSPSAGASEEPPNKSEEEYEFPTQEERLEGIWRTYQALRASGGSNWQSPLVRAQKWKESAFGRNKQAYWSTFDRVQVLGDETGVGSNGGHTGCVNALSWSDDGEMLISSGDDHRICMWRADYTQETESNTSSSESGLDSPSFACFRTIHTGHVGNVFNAHFLPCTNNAIIATCARDRQVRVFDITRGHAITTGTRPSGRAGSNWEEMDGCCTRLLKCHKGSVKRIVTEDSPNYFLTVSEDHTVRQHDLRTTHTCQSFEGRGCPRPLIRLPYSLSTIGCSPLTPFYFVVAGENSFAHLFDRRMTGRILKHEWGVSLDDLDESSAMCVRRFGRLKRGPNERRSSHVTGARMAKSNGHELLLSYSGDAAYLFSIRDDPYELPAKPAPPSLLPPNENTSGTRAARKRRKLNSEPQESPPIHEQRETEFLLATQSDDDYHYEGSHGDSDESTDSNEIGPLPLESAEEDDDDSDEEDDDMHDSDDDFERQGLKMPFIAPKRRFAGMCNVETVKDVNFLGPNDEWVTSGSDDGNFFIWSKFSGRLAGIWEGDGSVVNVVEDRPVSHSYPMLAVSGIDNTVKLFAPVSTPERKYCRTDSAETIISGNANQAERQTTLSQMRFAMIYSRLRSAGVTLADLEGENGDCTIM